MTDKDWLVLVEDFPRYLKALEMAERHGGLGQLSPRIPSFPQHLTNFLGYLEAILSLPYHLAVE